MITRQPWEDPPWLSFRYLGGIETKLLKKWPHWGHTDALDLSGKQFVGAAMTEAKLSYDPHFWIGLMACSLLNGSLKTLRASASSSGFNPLTAGSSIIRFQGRGAPQA